MFAIKSGVLGAVLSFFNSPPADKVTSKTADKKLLIIANEIIKRVEADLKRPINVRISNLPPALEVKILDDKTACLELACAMMQEQSLLCKPDIPNGLIRCEMSPAANLIADFSLC